MKLLHALHIYSTVFAKCMRLHFSRQCSNKLWVIQLRVCGQIISVFNSERIIKIGQYLPKLCSNEKGSSFFRLSCTYRVGDIRNAKNVVNSNCVHALLERSTLNKSVAQWQPTNNSTSSRRVAWRLCAILCEFSVADTFLSESVPSH